MRKITTAVMALLAFASCEIENTSNPSLTPNDTDDISQICGLWKCGDFYIDINNTELHSYIADDFIDNGEYEYRDNEIICYDKFFNRYTKYVVTDIGEGSLDISVEYTDINKNVKKRQFLFTKQERSADEIVLVGRSLSRYISYIGYETITFYDNGIASMRCDKLDDNISISLHYVYVHPYIFYQSFNPIGVRYPSIGGWNTNVDTGKVNVLQISYDVYGYISGYLDITDTY